MTAGPSEAGPAGGPLAGPPRYREIEARSVTRLAGSTDAWFLGRYGMNLYRGCEHGCAYCDGRAERYYVEGCFESDIAVKVNAPAVLAGELARLREPGFVFVGGGVCDAYQPAEARYRLARQVLELVLDRGLPVHVLTKSTLVERDLDLLVEIHRRARAILSFSIQTADEGVRRVFEPGAAPLAERWELLARARGLGLGTGVMAMPLLPGISDQPAALDRLAARAAAAGLDFMLCGGLTLRPGAQKDAYLAVLAGERPGLLAGTRQVYREERASGAGDPRYQARLERRCAAALARHGLAGRIPVRLFAGVIPLYAEAAVRLEQQACDARQAGRPASDLEGAAAVLQDWVRGNLARRGRSRGFSYRTLEQDLASMAADGSLARLPGFPPAALAAVREILGRRAGGGLFGASVE